MAAATHSDESMAEAISKLDLKILAITVATFYGLLGALNAWRRISQWSRSRTSAMQRVGLVRRQVNHKRSGLKALYRQHIALPALTGDTHMRATSVLGLPPVSLPTRLEAICMSFYLFLNILLGIIQYDYANPSALTLAAHRQGMFALLNLLFLALHAGRNSAIILITGLPFSTILFVHRWLGRLVVAQVAAHGLMIMYRTASAGGAAALKAGLSVPYIQWGVVSFAVGIAIFVQTWGPFRRAFYEAFHVRRSLVHLFFAHQNEFVHVALAIVFFVGAWLHRKAFMDQPDLYSLLRCAMITFIVELAIRILSMIATNVPFGKLYGDKKRLTYAKLQAVAGATRVKISVPKLWHVSAGQHIYLHVPSLGLFQAHPFSIAWIEVSPARGLRTQRTLDLVHFDTDEDENQKIEVIVKANDGFTRTLFQKAQDSPNCTIRCLVEGPYGTASRTNFDQFDEVTLICGGIGITFALLVMRHHLKQQRQARRINQRMSLIWIVRYDAEIAWAQSHLDYLIERSHGSLKISVYVTRPSVHEGKRYPDLTLRTTFIIPVKPDLAELVRLAVLDRTGTLAIASCGPGAFSDTIRKAMVNESEDGVTYIEEAFAW